MSKIRIELDISTTEYNTEAVELVRQQIRHRLNQLLIDCINDAPIGSPFSVGAIHHKFKIDGTIKLVD